MNRRLEFGSFGFMSLGGEVPHDHDESVSGKDQQHPDDENVAQKNPEEENMTWFNVDEEIGTRNGREEEILTQITP